MSYYGQSSQPVMHQPFFRSVQRGGNLFGTVKKKKILSKGLKVAGQLTGNKKLKKAGIVAKTVGLGRRRRRH